MVEDDPVRMLGFSMLSSTSLCCSFSLISIASNMEQKTKSRGSSSHSNKQAWLDSPPPHFVALYGWSCNGCNEAAAPCNSLTQERNYFPIRKRK
jgi:hypothetical protein